jgi:hypothetical protein
VRTNPEQPKQLAEEIAITEDKLEELEREIGEIGVRGLKRILGDHHPWHSPFVNRTHATIVAKFDLPNKDDEN